MSCRVQPIGFFHHRLRPTKLSAPRQPRGDQSKHSTIVDSYIELLPGQNFEQALEGLDQFKHLWVIFDFHLNDQWKPMVKPPRFKETKVGVFATRSPYRPNFLGLSKVAIQSIKGRRIFLSKSDLLDGTPIYDIKPDIKDPRPLKFVTTPTYRRQLRILRSLGVLDLDAITRQQLSGDPFNSSSKRVRAKGPQSGHGEFSLRKWRVDFSFDGTRITLFGIRSNYRSGEPAHPEDLIHRRFIAQG